MRRGTAAAIGASLCSLLAVPAVATAEPIGADVAVSRGTVASSSSTSSCVFYLRWRGRTYEAVGVEVSPRVGRRLGRGVLPPCNDTGGASVESTERVAIAALPGVAPRRALVGLAWNDTVFVRRSLLRLGRLPLEVRRLLRAPRCTSEGRVRLVGEWLGILGIDDQTENELVPPYALEMHVRNASKSRYVRAFLTIRVRSSLAAPLSREDIENVLWTGGDIATTVRCVRGRYVAVSVEARPR
jgi:Family of unknown function (DUF6281)